MGEPISGRPDDPMMHQFSGREEGAPIPEIVDLGKSETSGANYAEHLVADEDHDHEEYNDLFKSLRGRPVIDLGCGDYNTSAIHVIDIAERAGATSYVGVDKFRPNRASREHQIDVDFARDDMLAFLRTLPDGYGSVIMNGIDDFIIPDTPGNQAYLTALKQEIARVVPFDGIVYGYNSSHILKTMPDFVRGHHKEFALRREKGGELADLLEELASDPELLQQAYDVIGNAEIQEYLGLANEGRWRELNKYLVSENSAFDSSTLESIMPNIREIANRLERVSMSQKELRQNQELYDWLGIDVNIHAAYSAGEMQVAKSRSGIETSLTLVIPSGVSRRDIVTKIKEKLAQEPVPIFLDDEYGDVPKLFEGEMPRSSWYAIKPITINDGEAGAQLVNAEQYQKQLEGLGVENAAMPDVVEELLMMAFHYCQGGLNGDYYRLADTNQSILTTANQQRVQVVFKSPTRAEFRDRFEMRSKKVEDEILDEIELIADPEQNESEIDRLQASKNDRVRQALANDYELRNKILIDIDVRNSGGIFRPVLIP